MRRWLLAVCILALVGCGYTQRDGEMIGQVKKVSYRTNLLCDDYVLVDVSLGVLRGGVGSMSVEDVWLWVPDAGDLRLLRQVAETGQLVKIHFHTYRNPYCKPNYELVGVELVK